MQPGKEKKIAALISRNWTYEEIQQRLGVSLDDIHEVIKWRSKEWLESWHENEWLKLRFQLNFSKVELERSVSVSERFFPSQTYAYLRSRVI